MFSETEKIIGGKRAVMAEVPTPSLSNGRNNLIAMLRTHYGIPKPNIHIRDNVLVITTTPQIAKHIVDDANDFDFALRELRIAKITCASNWKGDSDGDAVEKLEDAFIYVTTPNFLGMGVTPDLVVCDLLDGGQSNKINNNSTRFPWLRALLISEAEKHVKRYLQADPENPILLLDLGVVNTRIEGKIDEPFSKLIELSQLDNQTGLDNGKRKRVQLAKDLLKVIECDTKTSTSEELVDIVQRTLPRDYFHTYLLARIHNKFNEPEKEKVALSEIDKERSRTYRLFALLICSSFASSLLFVTSFSFERKFGICPRRKLYPCARTPMDGSSRLSSSCYRAGSHAC